MKKNSLWNLLVTEQNFQEIFQWHSIETNILTVTIKEKECCVSQVSITKKMSWNVCAGTETSSFIWMFDLSEKFAILKIVIVVVFCCYWRLITWLEYGCMDYWITILNWMTIGRVWTVLVAHNSHNRHYFRYFVKLSDFFGDCSYSFHVLFESNIVVLYNNGQHPKSRQEYAPLVFFEILFTAIKLHTSFMVFRIRLENNNQQINPKHISKRVNQR